MPTVALRLKRRSLQRPVRQDVKFPTMPRCCNGNGRARDVRLSVERFPLNLKMIYQTAKSDQLEALEFLIEQLDFSMHMHNI